MREIISHHETYYKNRRIAPVIREIADSLPVVVITGARQVGKSTMLRTEFADYAYLTLDDYAVLEQARLDPGAGSILFGLSLVYLQGREVLALVRWISAYCLIFGIFLVVASVKVTAAIRKLVSAQG